MKNIRALLLALLLTGPMACPSVTAALAPDWSAWRGPTADGQAAAGQTVPTKWSETENVVWRAPIRGREKGDKDFFASPAMAGTLVYATSLSGVTSVFEATPQHYKLRHPDPHGKKAGIGK